MATEYIKEKKGTLIHFSSTLYKSQYVIRVLEFVPVSFIDNSCVTVLLCKIEVNFT